MMTAAHLNKAASFRPTLSSALSSHQIQNTLQQGDSNGLHAVMDQQRRCMRTVEEMTTESRSVYQTHSVNGGNTPYANATYANTTPKGTSQEATSRGGTPHGSTHSLLGKSPSTLPNPLGGGTPSLHGAVFEAAGSTGRSHGTPTPSTTGGSPSLSGSSSRRSPSLKRHKLKTIVMGGARIFKMQRPKDAGSQTSIFVEPDVPTRFLIHSSSLLPSSENSPQQSDAGSAQSFLQFTPRSIDGDCRRTRRKGTVAARKPTADGDGSKRLSSELSESLRRGKRIDGRSMDTAELHQARRPAEGSRVFERDRPSEGERGKRTSRNCSEDGSYMGEESQVLNDLFALIQSSDMSVKDQALSTLFHLAQSSAATRDAILAAGGLSWILREVQKTQARPSATARALYHLCSGVPSPPFHLVRHVFPLITKLVLTCDEEEVLIICLCLLYSLSTSRLASSEAASMHGGTGSSGSSSSVSASPWLCSNFICNILGSGTFIRLIELLGHENIDVQYRTLRLLDLLTEAEADFLGYDNRADCTPLVNLNLCDLLENLIQRPELQNVCSNITQNLLVHHYNHLAPSYPLLLQTHFQILKERIGTQSRFISSILQPLNSHTPRDVSIHICTCHPHTLMYVQTAPSMYRQNSWRTGDAISCWKNA